jgi:microsomal prostaglandin-E synthase 2
LSGSALKKENSDLNITLYQYATCPFCNRVKAYLDYVHIDYNVVEVNPMNKKELKSICNKKQVPVAVVNDEIVSDSSVIIQNIYDKVNSQSPQNLSAPNSQFMSQESLKWSTWSENKLAVVLYPNITRTFADSWAAFSYVSNVKEWSLMDRIVNRTLGPVAMYLVRNKIKQKHGIVVSSCHCVINLEVMKGNAV